MFYSEAEILQVSIDYQYTKEFKHGAKRVIKSPQLSAGLTFILGIQGYVYIIWVCDFRMWPVADPGDVLGARPLRTQSLSFLHTIFSKCKRLGSQWPPHLRGQFAPGKSWICHWICLHHLGLWLQPGCQTDTSLGQMHGK